MRELKTFIPQSHGEVFGWLAKKGIEPAGPPFVRYHVINMKAPMDVDVGVPVAGEPDMANWETEVAIKLADAIA